MARKRTNRKAEPRTSGPSSNADAFARGESPSARHFPIVGIGASAGGLSALRQLFSRMPEDAGIAYVIVAHLSPEHPSHLPELLQAVTGMPVRAVSATVAVERDHVYVIPPNANLDAVDTHLRLTELEPRRSERAPIDHFFRTLAAHHHEAAIGVVLSGTGSDGTLGLRSVKEFGGLAIVQDPREAESDGMPRSAILGAPVDLVLPLAEMPAAILRFARAEPDLDVSRDNDEVDVRTGHLLEEVFARVRALTGRDFTHYKRSTLLRRVARRMQFNDVADPVAYLDVLRRQPAEVYALADDLLINVTCFFRDPEVFALLEQDIIPKIFDAKRPGETVRVWSIGCATGEEPYSLAMLLLDEAAKRKAPPKVQVFATDLHQASLDRARDGAYAGEIQSAVGAERLKRYFKPDPTGHRLGIEVRETVVFAPHNLLTDPPFSRLDLISCRNLLIYLERELHRQVAELFHYALNPEGVLVLGSAETVDSSELFRVESEKRRVFRRRSIPGAEPRLPAFPLSRGNTVNGEAPGRATKQRSGYSDLHQLLVEQQGPPSVLVSPDDNVLHFSTRAGRYLVHPGGSPTTNVFRLVREELRLELRAALSSARAHKSAVRTKPIPVQLEGVRVPVALDARPASALPQEGFLLLIFDEYPLTEEARGHPGGSSHARIGELEAEKRFAEERLTQLIDAHESSQSEIRASNTDLQSANEELRSALEELETSKEELQSMNEELQAVNQENRHKMEELGQLSSDLQNLLTATDIATVFLDRELRILRFTPRIEQLFSVCRADRGRALADFTSRIGYDGLAKDARLVLDKLVTVERENQDDTGRWYLTRVLPYRSQEDRIEGVVITFVDITRQKLAERTVRLAKETSERILDTLPDPLLVLSRDLEILSANGSYYRCFETTRDKTVGHALYGVGGGQWNVPELVRLLAEATVAGHEPIEIDRSFEGIGRRVLIIEARHLDGPGVILLGFKDITQRFDAEKTVRESEGKLAEQLYARDEYLAMLGHELRNPLGALRSATELLKRGAAAPKLSRVFDVLDRQTAHMSRIIDGLLDVSRIARGKVTIHQQALDLRKVLRDTIEVRKPHLEKRGLALEVEVCDQALRVSGDETRLAQAIDNLLGNAIKFTDAGGTVTVSAEARDSTAVVRVRDSGTGIRREMLPLIFEPFQQELQDSARTAGGLGLGLPLARGIIELHGGTLVAESEGPGAGATFEIILPLLSSPDENRGDSVDATGGSGVESSRRVLVVEDSADAAEMMKGLLELSGHAVTVVPTAVAAIRLLKDNGADIVVCDIGLPGMSGLEFAAAVRADDTLRGIPLVAVTGYGQPEDRKRTRASGFDEHLVKPVDFDALNAMLARTRGKSRVTKRNSPGGGRAG